MQIAVSIADVVYHVVAAVALIVGGGWAYFKFIKGRTLKERLRVTVDGGLEPSSGLLRVTASCEAENISLRELQIAPEGTAVRLFVHTLAENPSEAREAAWELMGAWSVFGDREVLEPGEVLQEPKLLEVPEGGFAAMMLEFTVYSRSGSYWQAASVVTNRQAGDNQLRR